MKQIKKKSSCCRAETLQRRQKRNQKKKLCDFCVFGVHVAVAAETPIAAALQLTVIMMQVLAGNEQ